MDPQHRHCHAAIHAWMCLVQTASNMLMLKEKISVREECFRFRDTPMILPHATEATCLRNSRMAKAALNSVLALRRHEKYLANEEIWYAPGIHVLCK